MHHATERVGLFSPETILRMRRPRFLVSALWLAGIGGGQVLLLRLKFGSCGCATTKNEMMGGHELMLFPTPVLAP